MPYNTDISSLQILNDISHRIESIDPCVLAFDQSVLYSLFSTKDLGLFKATHVNVARQSSEAGIIYVCIPSPGPLVFYQACPAFVHSEANAISAINVLKLSKLS